MATGDSCRIFCGGNRDKNRRGWYNLRTDFWKTDSSGQLLPPLMKPTTSPWILTRSVVLSVWMVAQLAAQTPITIDGAFADWLNVPILYSSPSGTGAPGQIDFGQLQVANDQRFLFVRIELGKEIILQESNNLQLLIDTDLNAATGTSFNGIGADLIWSFGQRSGLRQQPGQSTTLFHSDIRLRSAPTVSSSVFEFCIDRTSQVNGSALFPSATIRLLLRDGTTGDRIPLSGQTVQYTFQSAIVPTEAIPLERQSADDLRLLSWNVRNDGLWNTTQSPRFRRILTAIQPDIINFQEIYGRSTSETASLIANWLPIASPGTWYSAGSSDRKTLSRFPILDSWSVAANLVLLIDTTSKLGRPSLVVNLHLPCCENNSGRQSQIDQLLAFIRDAKNPGGVLTLDEDTPMIINGDLNLVTFSSQLSSLLNGQIQNQSSHGPSFQPDWNGQPFVNLFSRHSDKRMGYTWRNDSSSYSPGWLDFHVYTGSMLEVPRHYIVNTEAMSSARLSSAGLLWNDSWASDHYAFVADYRLVAPPVASIVNQFVYHSGWTGIPSNGLWDAIDSNKQLAREGSGPLTLSLEHLINSSRGINGLGFDFENLGNAEELSGADFVFQMSPQGAFSSGANPPASWGNAPAAAAVSVYPGSPTRVLLQWPDNILANRWLRITVLANSNTGLAEPQVFYLGHLLGESTGSQAGFYTVSFSDIVPIRNVVGQSVGPGSFVDIDKNGIVSFSDISAMRPAVGAELTNLTIP